MTENEAMLLGKLSAATARTADVEARLADCERRERAAVERAGALRAALEAALANVYSSGVEGPPIRAALAADDEARAT